MDYKDLHKYQIKMIDWMLANKRCALWAGVGLGKTVTTLTAISHLIQNKQANRVLIIAPLRVAKFVWPTEIKKWKHLDKMECTVIHGGRKTREGLLRSDHRIHVINKENVVWLVDTLAKTNYWPYDCVVLDESSAFKNPKSKRFKALRQANHRIDRLIELTGTPASNGLMDVWAQVHLLDGGERLGRTMTLYKQTYFDSDYMGWTFTPKVGAKEQIYGRLQDVCLTMDKADYLDLPPLNKNNLFITLEGEPKNQYEELERNFILEIQDETVTASQAGVLSNKLLQFCGGAVYGEDALNHPNRWVTVHDAKIKALGDILDEMAGEPVMVAYNYKHELFRLREAFPYGTVLDTKADEDKWNAREIPLMFVHPQSVGHGLNLQAGGNNLVWFSLTWDLELYDQLNGRLDRQGQTKPVFIHHLVIRETIEEKVLQTLGDKSVTQADLLNAMKHSHN